MPYRCCMVGCHSNYKQDIDKNGTYPVFKIPTEPNLRQIWISKIGRENFNVNSSNVRVCILHFAEHFIDRVQEVRKGGKVIIVDKKRITLTKDAYPSYFNNQPTYRSSEPPRKRKSPMERAEEIIASKKAKLQEEKDNDIIISVAEINNNIKKLKGIVKIELGEWIHFPQANSAIFIKLEGTVNPNVAVSLKIQEDLSVEVYQGSVQLSDQNIPVVSGHSWKCNSWATLANLLNALKHFKIETLTIEQKLIQIQDLIKIVSQSLDNNDEMPGSEGLNKKLAFIAEQIKLTLTKIPKYSTETILWACRIYFTFPGAYKMLRDLGLFCLPHPAHLRRISSSVSSLDAGLEENHLNYLIQRANLLKPKEKFVYLLADEIHSSPCLKYKGGRLIGNAVNSNEPAPAHTVQTFMISSLYSHNKEVVAMFPVKNITGEQMYKMTLGVLGALKKCGYTVIAVITDNNKVNQNMFESLCKGPIKPFILNPVDPDKKLFLMYDPVHIFKNIRNNWLNQKISNQTFFFPVMEKLVGQTENPNIVRIVMASLLHLKSLYSIEKNNLFKVAPGLSRKVLYPSSLERQNVKPVVQLFSETNVAAVSEMKQKLGFAEIDVEGTSHFLNIILHWWKIVNVKTPNKGVGLRDPLQDPVKSESGPQLTFLYNFLAWLDVWDNLPMLEEYEEEAKKKKNSRIGKLTSQTHFALKHTTEVLVQIAKHCLNDLNADYVMLGTAQTDVIEDKFGSWRTMSGRNYHVSYSQMLESERKIRFLSLLKIKSASNGEFNITEFVKSFQPESSQVKSVSEDVYLAFAKCLDLCDQIDIPSECLAAAIYIAGYAAKSACSSIKCKECRDCLVYDKALEFDYNSDHFSYLCGMDRGGLSVPKDLPINLTLLAYKLFQCIVGGKMESKFLQINCQKSLIKQLVHEKFEISLSEVETCSCGLTTLELASKCIPSLANILLNNYSKNKTDAISAEKNERKLATLKK